MSQEQHTQQPEAPGPAARPYGQPDPAQPSIPVNPMFVNFLCYSVDPVFRRLPDAERARCAREFLAALAKKRPDLSARVYLSVGLRHDTDFFLWAIAKEMGSFHGLASDILASGLGAYLKVAHTFLAMTRPSVYNPGHVPAFEKDEPSRKYLFLYPFVKSREWYLLPFEERREMMRSHMKIGEQYPMVRLNTTYSFGLGDQDFVLAFETDKPEAFEDLVQRLRESKASKYTVRDTPFILGSWCENGGTLTKGLGF